MHLKCHRRRKDGKEHRYWSIVESRRCSGAGIVDRHVLYLGEINDSQKQAWLKCIEVFDEQSRRQERLALFAADAPIPEHAREHAVQVRLGEFKLRRPRQWFTTSAMGDLLGADFALAAKDTLYRCLDKLLAHKEALFGFLHQRWQDLFGVRYERLWQRLHELQQQRPSYETLLMKLGAAQKDAGLVIAEAAAARSAAQ